MHNSAPNFVAPLFRHAWVFLMASTTVHAIFFRMRTRYFWKRDLSLKPGYDRLFRGVLFYMNLPWLVMAFNDLTGLTDNIFNYMDLRAGNPGVIIWFVCVGVLYILSIRWIYFRGGAEFLSRHPGMIHITFLGDEHSARTVRIVWGIFTLGGIFFLLQALFGIPLRPIHG